MDDPIPPELQRLLDEASQAAPADRIKWRDRIAAFGRVAVPPMVSWVADRRLGAFAVRVLEVIGKGPDRAWAIAGLKKRRADGAGSAAIEHDIVDALRRLGADSAPPPGPPQDPYAVSPLPGGAGRTWPGFQPHEFGQIAGTHWRSRDGTTSLAPLITRALRYQHPHFESYGVSRLPELHFAIAERFHRYGERASGWRAAKLFVYAYGSNDDHPAVSRHVAAGLYIEKGDGSEPYGPVNDDWDWPHFVALLDDPHVQRELAAAMQRHGLRIGAYWLDVAAAADTGVGFVARLEDGQLVCRDGDGEVLGAGWAWMQSRLRALDAATWHDLHIWRTWPADEAIAAGPSFAFEELLPVLSDLTGVYLDVVGPLLPGWTVAR